MNYGNEVYFARQRGQHGINSNIFCNTLSLKCSGRWLVTYVLFIRSIYSQFYVRRYGRQRVLRGCDKSCYRLSSGTHVVILMSTAWVATLTQNMLCRRSNPLSNLTKFGAWADVGNVVTCDRSRPNLNLPSAMR